MATYDLTEFLEDDAVVLEGIRSEAYPAGREYRFESPSAEVGLYLKNLIDLGRDALLGRKLSKAETERYAKGLHLDDDEERDLYRKVMGETFDEMVLDNVKWESIGKIFQLLLAKWGSGQPIETTLAEAGKAPTPVNRATRRAAAKKAPAKRAAAGSSRAAGSKSSQARTARKKAPGSSVSQPPSARTSTRASKTSAAKAKAAASA